MGSRVLDEVRARRAELHEALRALEAAVTGRGGMVAVRGALAGLRDAFEDHLVVNEGPGGLHDQVLADAPRLDGAVRRLQADHVELRREIAAALARAQESADQGDVTSLAADARGLLRHLEQHRSEGLDLIHEAFGVDIGGAGD